jgi:hypothetical protein
MAYRPPPSVTSTLRCRGRVTPAVEFGAGDGSRTHLFGLEGRGTHRSTTPAKTGGKEAIRICMEALPASPLSIFPSPACGADYSGAQSPNRTTFLGSSNRCYDHTSSLGELVAGDGLEPSSSAYETELEPLQSNPHRKMVGAVGIEPTRFRPSARSRALIRRTRSPEPTP